VSSGNPADEASADAGAAAVSASIEFRTIQFVSASSWHSNVKRRVITRGILLWMIGIPIPHHHSSLFFYAS